MAISFIIMVASFFLIDVCANNFTIFIEELHWYKVAYRIHNYAYIHILSLNLSLGSILRSSGK
jgi:hypothetical protein